MAAAGRKRKGPTVPERNFHPLGEPQGGNVLDSEIQAETTERETGQSSMDDHSQSKIKLNATVSLSPLEVV